MKPVVLIILDGWGLAPPGPGNATTLAKTPNFSSFWSVYPKTQLLASGEAVGLPPGEMGNSETGHLNLGAGRIVYQDLPRINMAIADGSFFKISAFLEAIEHARKLNSNLHFLGLVGQGGVHSSTDHLFALLRFCREQKFSNVYLHLFTDGRDSPPTSALTFIAQTEAKIKELGIGKIATIIGRYYALDRDNRWERTQKAYEAIVKGEGKKTKKATGAIQNSYTEGKTDEFIEPIILLDEDGKPITRIAENDSVIFFNFRIDRPRQLTKAFVIPDFEKLKGQRAAFDPYTEKYYHKTYVEQIITATFPRGPALKNLFFVTMTEYERGLPVKVAFPSTIVNLPLGRILSERGLRQLRITETEKERFVTYYFNGQREDPFPGEDRIIVPSPQVSTYDQKPEMSAPEITQILTTRLQENTHDFMVVNFANPDMVGHTGVLQAGIKACEIVDQCLGEVVKIVLHLGGIALITADHGNVEEMIDPKTGEVDTEHSTNPVPFMVVDQKLLGKKQTLLQGVLADIAPTILSFLKIAKPTEMSGKNLLL